MKRLFIPIFIVATLATALYAFQNFSRLASVEPDTAKVGDAASAKGENLAKTKIGELYLTDGKNDVKATITEQSDTEIKFKIPKIAAGRYRLMLVTAKKGFHDRAARGSDSRMNPHTSRRAFLRSLGAAAASLPLHRLSAALKNKVKITDVKCMIVRGTWDWNLIRIDTDSGLYGLGEAYWGPGVKDLVLKQMKQLVVGEDPLNVDKLYTKMLMKSGGYGAIAGVTVTAASGIEIALWDLAGKILGTPVCNLLGGRFRDRVQFYRTMQLPERVNDHASWRDMVHQAKAEKFGWKAFKFQGDGVPVAADPQFRETGHDPYLRNLTAPDIRRIVKGMEVIREELGPDTEFGIDLHWHYDVRDAIQLGKALEPVRPMWIEDPVPPDNPEAMALVRRSLNIPVCTGENLYTRQGFRKLIELQACDAVHIDIPKSGGLLESKKISDMAEMYYIWTAAHNPASPVGTIASAHAASSMRNFRVHELAKYIDWWQDLVIHEGPVIEGGYLTIQDKPGYGIELNPDVAKAHLAPGEEWWGTV